MRALPVLEQYGLSAKSGFLPAELPLSRLPDYFEPWESIVKDLPALIMTSNLRKLVDAMPLLDATRLNSEPEWHRACSILSFMAHGYVWSRPEASKKLPKCLAEPWIAVCDHFDLPPIASYAGLCLWNFRTVLPCDSPSNWNLENLAALTTYTGSMDEAWFYLVSTMIERQGGPCLEHGLQAIAASREKDVPTVVAKLQALAENIDAIITTLNRMHETCDPHFFYFRLRPFLAGWKNMAAAGLPDGVVYGDEAQPRQYSGGSNAQSSLIQALDILLNVVHHPEGERQPPRMESKTADGVSTPPPATFLLEMRKYMPVQHRKFLFDLEKVAEIRQFVVENATEHPELVTAYDACLAMLRNLRSRHIQIVTRYIIMPARAENKTIRDGIARDSGETGTGGTTLLPFLKQARDEVGDAAAGAWGRRLLSSAPPPNAKRMKTAGASASEDRTAGSLNTATDHW
ncbi:Indoleamine 2,3-dioxygenase [Wickerhamiella sorbophila]|uniref:Indoleamine 2,3-dioxygenase n=1 Tax=Wickerhamiella sorbophila TaxID=45607 RepID=A0A2T0FDA1_9ASCO|nr:Indoleamine 2,3-dioxygenase [Wickerhamiella sorbophila]PRT52940.1 Indoleamine 2,3-dioxygenase [Wickerhamiella sorbophila]